MRALSKAKLAAKRAALKGASRRDAPLDGAGTAAHKIISSSRTRAQNLYLRAKTNGKYHKDITPTLPYHETPVSTSDLPRPLAPRIPAARILQVTSKVTGQQIPAVRTLQVTSKVVEQTTYNIHPSRLNAKDFGSIKQLRKLLGLRPRHISDHADKTLALPEDALIVSFDTECERQGPSKHVVEIGVTTLDTRDIVDVAPGPFAHDWISKTKTYHYVVDITSRPETRMGACYFSDDLLSDVSTIKRDIISILQQSAHPRHEPSRTIGDGPRKIVLVGHSVHMDLQNLSSSPGLDLDLTSEDVFSTKPIMTFDTYMLASAAIEQGARIWSLKLGQMVNWLGLDHQYRLLYGAKACHNAGNDAAYTMMALLLYAVRWEQIVTGEMPCHHEEAMRQRRLRSKNRDSRSQDTTPVLLNRRARRKALSSSEEIARSKTTLWNYWSHKLLGLRSKIRGSKSQDTTPVILNGRARRKARSSARSPSEEIARCESAFWNFWSHNLLVWLRRPSDRDRS